MATVGFRINRINCRGTSLGPGNDEIVFLLVVTDPIGKTHQTAVSRMVSVGDGQDFDPGLVFPELSFPGAARLTWDLSVWELDAATPVADIVSHAQGIGERRTSELVEALAALGKLPPPAGWAFTLTAQIVAAFIELVSFFERPDLLGGHKGALAPMVNGVHGPLKFTCTGDSSDYDMEYGVGVA